MVGLSGGVDSAAAAFLLKRAGAEVEAVFMKNWQDDDEAGCHDRQDMITAAAVAESLALPFSVVNFADTYRQQVFEPFLHELRQGKTPNPDVLCNQRVKFSVFHSYASRRGADAVATGHYARRVVTENSCQLYKAEDTVKDQTYFLHRLSSEQLRYSHFPIGKYHKNEVRALARRGGLSNWQRKDSTGICFIGARRFNDFIVRYLPPVPGSIQDERGRELGQHQGLHFYTIGQRRGVGLGGRGAPWFVAGKRPEQNVLLVVQGEHHPLLYRQQVQIDRVHWIGGTPPPPHWVYSARLRHRHPPASCTLSAVNAETATIEFAEPQRAVTPGQYAVIYDGDLCLGGGVICAVPCPANGV